MISINKYVENGSQGDDGDYLDFFMRQIKNDVNVNSVGEKAQVTTDSENIESKFLKFIQISKQMYIDPWLLVELQQITNMKICTKIK